MHSISIATLGKFAGPYPDMGLAGGGIVEYRERPIPEITITAIKEKDDIDIIIDKIIDMGL